MNAASMNAIFPKPVLWRGGHSHLKIPAFVVMYGRMRKYGTQPAAMLITESVSVAVTTAMNLKEPVMTDFDIDPCKVIKTGDHVIVNADEGYVKIVRE